MLYEKEKRKGQRKIAAINNKKEEEDRMSTLKEEYGENEFEVMGSKPLI